MQARTQEVALSTGPKEVSEADRPGMLRRPGGSADVPGRWRRDEAWDSGIASIARYQSRPAGKSKARTFSA